MSPRSFPWFRPVPLPQFRILRQFPQKGTLRICLHLLQQAGDQGTLDLSGGLPGGQVPVEGRAAQVPGHRQAVEQPVQQDQSPRAVLLRHRQLKGCRQHRVVRQIQHLSARIAVSVST